MTGSGRVIINLCYTNVFHCYLQIQCHLGDQGISSNSKPAAPGPSKISFISIPKASFLFSYKISTFGVLGVRWHAFGRNLLLILMHWRVVFGICRWHQVHWNIGHLRGKRLILSASSRFAKINLCLWLYQHSFDKGKDSLKIFWAPLNEIIVKFWGTDRLVVWKTLP